MIIYLSTISPYTWKSNYYCPFINENAFEWPQAFSACIYFVFLQEIFDPINKFIIGTCSVSTSHIISKQNIDLRIKNA